MSKTFDTKKEKEKAFLFIVAFSGKDDIDAQKNELKSLAETAGAEVVGWNYQILKEFSPATLIGSGKVEELKQKLLDLAADLLIVDYELTGSQTKNLSDALGVRVIDRITLILDIFASRATTNEGKIQVELAQAKYFLPRLSALSGTSGRFGSGGVGMRGPGETKLETKRRVLEQRILILEKELSQLHKQRETKNKGRKESSKTKVAIVGYTNSGKSTLLNLISKANIYADNKLFATLETTSRSVWLDLDKEIILTDTVGFISKLPHTLIHAFKSTLDEAIGADIILHVVDVSNKDREIQMQVALDILKELEITAPIITVYNKCDKIHVVPKLDEMSVCISAKENKGIDELKKMIMSLMK